MGASRRAASRSPREDRARFDAVAERLARRIAALAARLRAPRLPVAQPHGRAPATTPELCWIDFQDALLGPRVYDLVALLNDSYQTFDRAFVEARLDDYARAARRSTPRRAPSSGASSTW